MTRISKIIRVARTIEGMSQMALSEQIGVPCSSIRRIESNKPVNAGVALKVMFWLFECEDAAQQDVNDRMI